MSPFIKIVRPVNLGIIILTQVLLRFCIVEVYLGLSGVKPAMGYPDFMLLVMATVLIAAGGYVINDIFDREVDLANKPDKVVVGRTVTLAAARQYYWFLTIPGIIIGFYLGLRVDYLYIGFVFPAVAVMLYAYSAKYQKSILLGNVMVSLMSALVILVEWLFEFFALKQDVIHFIDAMRQVPVLHLIVAGYSLFAFFVSMMREIVKDAEDRKGDEQGGYRTLAVVYGIAAAKRLTMGIQLLTMALLAGSMYLLYREGLTYVFWYLALAVMLLLAYILYQLSVAGTRGDFHFLSNAYKLIMLAGVLSMELFYISY